MNFSHKHKIDWYMHYDRTLLTYFCKIRKRIAGMERAARRPLSPNERNLIKDAIQFVTRAMQLANDIDICRCDSATRFGKRLMKGTVRTNDAPI